jgi:hypothetical protein
VEQDTAFLTTGFQTGSTRELIVCGTGCTIFNYIVSGCMGMIKSRSIIPHSPTDHGPRTTPPSCMSVTGIDIIGFLALATGKFIVCGTGQKACS